MPSFSLPSMSWNKCTTVDGVPALDCLPQLAFLAISWLVLFAGVISLVFIVISGIKYITSHGDPKNLDSARKTLTYSILGLVLVFLSFAIINFIGYVTGVSCITPGSGFSFSSPSCR